LRAHRSIGRGQRGESFDERLEIEHRAAHGERYGAARADFLDRANGVGAKAGCRVRVGRIDDIDQMMSNARPRRCVGLCRADVHAAVHLRRIDAHDLGPHALGEGERERALPGGGRSHQQHRRDRRDGG
jgi:hypothetical protein